jgi:hypothetical protein
VCGRKEQLLGGGATLPDADPESTDPPSVEQNGPIDKRTWYAVGHTDNDTVTLLVTALCLRSSSLSYPGPELRAVTWPRARSLGSVA